MVGSKLDKDDQKVVGDVVLLLCGSGAITIDGLAGGDIALLMRAWFVLPDGVYYEHICFSVESYDMSFGILFGFQLSFYYEILIPSSGLSVVRMMLLVCFQGC